jgi:deoxyadenosine/deoxycytidine kinase
MILFINGAFGVGKTTAAELLVKRIPNSLLYDAEEVGVFLSHIVRPIVRFEDFQDLPMWRTLTVATAQLLQQTYGRTLIMPMTIWYMPYFEEVLHGLRQFEPHLYHFCLTAKAETIRKRLLSRNYTPEAHPFCYERIDRCVDAFQSPAFAVQLAADDKTPEELVEEMLALIEKRTKWT